MKVVLLFRQAAGAEGSRMPERVRNFHASGGEKLTADGCISSGGEDTQHEKGTEKT